MKNRNLLVIFLTMILSFGLIIQGCDNSSDDDNDPTPTPTPTQGPSEYTDMNGSNWNFVDHLSGGDDASPGTIVQTGNDLSITYDNYPSFGPLVGTLNGDSFMVSGPNSDGETTWTYTGTVNSTFTSASGTITITEISTGDENTGTFDWTR